MSVSPASRPSLATRFAWLGLLLMAISFAWLQLGPSPEQPVRHDETSSRNPAISLVIVDAGHGGQDSGAMRNGILEKDLTLDVALRIEGLARASGFRVILTRPNDSWVSLPTRAAVANRENDCVFVSIHFDEGGRPAATGVQTFYALRSVPKAFVPSWLPFLQPILPQPVNFESQSLAGFVQQGLVVHTQAFDRGTRAEQFFVVANVRHPSVLVEGGFLSNDGDIARLTTEAYRQELAAGVTDGIVHYREVVNQRAQTLALGGPQP